MNASTQTLIRSALKIGGGYMIAHGIATASTLQTISAGAVALSAVIWGLFHRTSVSSVSSAPGNPGNRNPGQFLFSCLLSPIFYLLLLGTGCATYTSRITMPDGTTLALPKDATGDALVLEREFTDAIGRTNRLRLYMTNFSFKMNPAVIDAKTKHDIAVFNAGADAAGKIISAIPK